MRIESIWPHDCVDIDAPETALPHQYTCFLIAPFTPNEAFEELKHVIGTACEAVSKMGPFTLRLKTAEDADQTRPIHPQIWAWIRHADIIIADITGYNGNVMLELGVASAWRDLRNVIIMQAGEPEDKILFDVQPIKHIRYNRSWFKINVLINNLAEAMFHVLVSAPFDIAPGEKATLPLAIEFGEFRDSKFVASHALGHRRPLVDCLEFGSFYDFRSSWLDVGKLSVRNVKAEVAVRFTELPHEPKHMPFIGIAVRSQYFYANLEHLLFLTADGRCKITLPPEGPHEPKERDKPIGTIDSFDPSDPTFLNFSIEVDDRQLKANIQGREKVFRVDEIPYAFGPGRVLIQTFSARAGVKKIHVQSLD